MNKTKEALLETYAQATRELFEIILKKADLVVASRLHADLADFYNDYIGNLQ